MISGRRATAGEFKGDGVVPLRGSETEDFGKEFTRQDTRR